MDRARATVVFGAAFVFLWACGASDAPAEPPAVNPTSTSTPDESGEASAATWSQTTEPADPSAPVVEAPNGPNFTQAVSTSSHLLIVRVEEFGMLEERAANGDRRSYDYAWLAVVNTLFGNTSDVIAPFATRFPVFHMTGMETADGQRDHAIPSPLSRLRGHTGGEAIFIGSLPTERASRSGEVPTPLAADGHGTYIVELRELAGTAQVQDVMAVVGPL